MKLLTSLASLTALAAACSGSGTSGTARFADASQMQLARTVFAAVGGDVELAAFTPFVALGNSCPVVSTSGNDTDVSGGCTDSNGVAYAGSAQFTDFQALAGSGSGTATMTFDHFSATGSAASGTIEGFPIDAYEYDGTAEMNTTTLSTTGFEATFLGISVTTTMDLTCTTTTCSFGDGATLDVTGLGSVDVRGTWSKAGTSASASMEIDGADTLTLTPGGSNCLSYAISDGGSGQLCDGSGS
jgi:hypothetical protein